jgi:hypothetical protein
MSRLPPDRAAVSWLNVSGALTAEVVRVDLARSTNGEPHMALKLGLPQPQVDKIGLALQAKGAGPNCPRCSQQLSVVGFGMQKIHTELADETIDGPSVRTVVIACSNCGFICQHVLEPLGVKL